MERSNLSTFHFLLAEMLKEAVSRASKEGEEIEILKQRGIEIGIRIFPIICSKKDIRERPRTIGEAVSAIQTKVFKFLFDYEAKQWYRAESKEDHEQFAIIDERSSYLTWMPQKNWDTCLFIAGILEGILNAWGLKCTVGANNPTSEVESNGILTCFGYLSF